MKMTSLSKVMIVVLFVFHYPLSSASLISQVSHTLSGIDVGACVRPAAQFVSRHVSTSLLATVAVVGATVVASPAVRRSIRQNIINGSLFLGTSCKRSGFFSIARWFGSNLDELGLDGNTLLTRAIMNHDAGLVEALRAAGASLEVTDKQGRTPLYRAVELSCNDLVSLLLSLGADPNPMWNSGTTAIHRAVEAGNIECVRMLVQSQANLCPFKNNMKGKITPLGIAIERKDLEMVKFLVSLGVPINDLCSKGPAFCGPSEYEMSPLAKAVSEGSVEIAMFLINNGADVNYKNRANDMSIFDLALDHPECGDDFLRLLSKKGARPDWSKLSQERLNEVERIIYKPEPIIEAVLRSDLAEICRLADQGVDFNENFLFLREGGHLWDGTPLFLAAERGDVRVYAELLRFGKEPDKMIDHAFSSAFIKEDIDAVKFIIRQGVKPEILQDALYDAVCHDSPEGIAELLRAGADMNATTFVKGIYPLSSALRPSSIAAALRAGATVNKVDNWGVSILLRALIRGHISLLPSLLDAGADISLACKNSFLEKLLALKEHNTWFTGMDRQTTPELLDFVVERVQESQKLGVEILGAACQGDNERVKAMLADPRVPRYMEDEHGNTLLHYAVRSGDAELVKLLVSAHKKTCSSSASDTYIHECNKRGQTPLHLASQGDNGCIYRYLRLHGADMFAEDKEGNMALPPMSAFLECVGRPGRAADIFVPYTNTELDQIRAERAAQVNL